MSMKSIQTEGMNTQDFVDKMKGALEGREIGKIVSFRATASEIVVVFSKLGTTEITYSVAPAGTGFMATLKNEKVAFAHKPFRTDMEAKLMHIMKKIGAKVNE